MSQNQHPNLPATIEGLPTTGPMGTEPSLTVGTLMGAITIIVSFLIAAKVYAPSAEIRAWADQYGVMAAGGLVAAWQWLQAWLTRNRVVSPASALALLSIKVPFKLR